MDPGYPWAAEGYDHFRRRLRSSALPRVRSPRPPRLEDEREIQAKWFGGEYGRHFEGSEGERIEVLQFGHWNRGAGPDFTEAAIRVDGELRRGSVEIDLDVRSWESHGHGANPAFNGTVLHVFTDRPALRRVFTRTEEHREVAQVLLPQYCGLVGPPDFLPEAFPGRCLAPLARMGEAEVRSLLLSASQYRLRRKAERIRVMGGATTLEQALYQATAEALGYRWNKTAMAILAQRCPVAELRFMAPAEREARLFGAAGFLDPPSFGSGRDDDAYLRELHRRWERMRGAVALHPRRSIRWRGDGTRPLNHPQRRVAALAAFLAHWREWRSWWQEPVNNFERRVNNWSETLEHPYWNRHHTLSSSPLPRPCRLLGRDRLRDWLGNVIFPGAIGIFPERWEEYTRLRAVSSNQKLRRATLRLLGGDPTRTKLFTRYYHQQQGLLQIFEDFCLEDASECRDCPFPEQLSQWRRSDAGAAGPGGRPRPEPRGSATGA